MRWSDSPIPPVPACGFAVVDLETTGLSPRTDRVVELSVIQLSDDLSPCGEFTTLVKPGRDIGATHIHGITARDVVDAPRFEHIAPTLLDILRGRVIVAHNVQFDLRFLRAEFERAGIAFPELPVLCTMRLAPQYLKGLPARTLAACCLTAGIPLNGAHAAVADARAAAQLLVCYARVNGRIPADWLRALTSAAQVSWPALPLTSARPVSRETAARVQDQEVPFLAQLVQQLPRTGSGAGVESYLAALDTVLEDRRVTTEEAQSLRELAGELGIGADAVTSAHQMYLRALAIAAWADGVVTDGEYADLTEVARLLGFPVNEVDTELATARNRAPQTKIPVNGRELHLGDSVCITGTTRTPRVILEARATEAGLKVASAVSRKTCLLVAADPDSESGKARRARQLDVPIVAEQVFITLLDRGVNGLARHRVDICHV